MTLRRTLLSLLLIAGVAAAMVTVASMASFTDQVVSENNQVSAGTLYLSVDNQCKDRQAGSGGAGGGQACNMGSIDFTNALLKPGDQLTKTLQVKNEGSLDGRLSVDVNVTGGDQCIKVELQSPVQNLDLNKGATTAVTLKVSMPHEAANTCQGKAATAKVTFNLAQR